MKNYSLPELRLIIADKVRALRRERQWTQARLAGLLGISQNRLSEIERGGGSFTAEQLLLLISTFNLQFDYFSAVHVKAFEELQNTLARFGAADLRENVLPGGVGRGLNADEAVLEALIAADSPRQVAAIAPVLVAQAGKFSLGRLRLRAAEAGYEARLGWALDNVLAAIREELPSVSGPWRSRYRRALLLISSALAAWPQPKEGAEDILDHDILSEESAEEVRAERSPLARKWGVVTRITLEDFRKALIRGARGNY